jgi:hypothetical protein
VKQEERIAKLRAVLERIVEEDVKDNYCDFAVTLGVCQDAAEKALREDDDYGIREVQ